MEFITDIAFATTRISRQNKCALRTLSLDLVFPGGCIDTFVASAAIQTDLSQRLACAAASIGTVDKFICEMGTTAAVNEAADLDKECTFDEPAPATSAESGQVATQEMHANCDGQTVSCSGCSLWTQETVSFSTSYRSAKALVATEPH